MRSNGTLTDILCGQTMFWWLLLLTVVWGGAPPFDDLVLTPYGMVPRSRVIALDSKTTTAVVSGHLVKTELATGKVIQDFGPLTAEDLEENDPREYAAQLAVGASGGGGMKARSVAPAGGINHRGYTAEAYTGPVEFFSTKWVVPDLPANTTAHTTCFLWNGLDGGSLQPVLQWDQGKPGYTLSNWCFNNGHYHHGIFIPVAPGAVLEGAMTFISNGTGQLTQSNNSGGPIDPEVGPTPAPIPIWTYLLQFIGYPDGDITVSRSSVATSLIVCWEAYTTDTTQWPANLAAAMYDMNARLISGKPISALQWDVVGGTPVNTSTGFNTVFISNSSTHGEVDFYWGGEFGVVSGGVYRIVSALDPATSLGLDSGYCVNGTGVGLGDPPASQLWRVFNAGGGNTILVPLIAPASPMGAVSTSPLVQIYDGNTSTTQLWVITPVSDGPYYAITQNSHAVDVSGGTAQLLPSSGAVSQQFLFVQEIPPDDTGSCIPVPSPTPATPTPDGSHSQAIIIGAAVGGSLLVVLLAGLTAGVVIWLWRQKSSSARHEMPLQPVDSKDF